MDIWPDVTAVAYRDSGDMTLQVDTTNQDAVHETRLPLTREAHGRLEDELEQLLRDHQSFSGADDDAIIAARVARIEDILARAELIQDATDTDLISIGSVVTVLDHGSGRTETYIVDGAHGSLDSNVVSAVSPMGVALMGRERGDVVHVDLPRGRTRTLTVLDVAPAESP